ncbi:MAG: 30S ribosome-binding factor RbfA [Clostridia bacterium]|nr:30S ribosome-binding factor RbfA [Clostridia bacterium]
MPSYRINKINEQVREVMTEIFRTVKDPRVSRAFVSVSAADVAKDLSVAKIYYGVITGDPADVAKGLASASGYIRSELASKLNLRVTPRLVFIKDESGERALRIAELLKEDGVEK